MDSTNFPVRKAGKVAIACLSHPKALSSYDRLNNAVKLVLSDSDRLDLEPIVLRCPDSDRQKQLERQGKDGSMTEIFRTACEAFDKSWCHIAIADNLTFRQLAGDLRKNEKRDPSLVVLQLSKKDHAEEISEPSWPLVRAMRYEIREAVEILGGAFNINIATTFDYRQWPFEADIFYEYGTFIYHADSPLFQQFPKEGDPRLHREDAIREALGVKHSLPAEIVDIIEDQINEDLPLEELTKAPKHLSSRTDMIEIHMLTSSVHAKAVEAAINRKLSECNEKMPAVVYEWTGHLPATRREFCRLWDRIVQENIAPFWMLACFLDSATAVDDDEITIAIWNYVGPAFAYKITFDDLVSLWKKRSDASSPGQRQKYELDLDRAKAFEVLHHPDARFFPDPPLWRCIDCNDHFPTVFIIIDNSKSEYVEQIKAVMCSDIVFWGDTRDGPPYQFIEWNGGRDGNVEDVLRIAMECFYHQGRRRGEPLCIFADRQTLEDGTVIMCEYLVETADENESEDQAEPFEGIRYARTEARDAWLIWSDLHGEDMDWEVFYEEEDYTRLQRPARTNTLRGD